MGSSKTTIINNTVKNETTYFSFKLDIVVVRPEKSIHWRDNQADDYHKLDIFTVISGVQGILSPIRAVSRDDNFFAKSRKRVQVVS